MVRPKSRLGTKPSTWARAAGLRAVLAVLLLSFGVAGCRREPPTLHELSGLDALKAQFNADAGKPRVVLLLSPT